MDSMCRSYGKCSTCLGQSENGCIWLEGESYWPCRDGLLDVDFDDDIQLSSVVEDCADATGNSTVENHGYGMIWIICLGLVIAALILVGTLILYKRSYRRVKNPFRIWCVTKDPEFEMIELVSLA